MKITLQYRCRRCGKKYFDPSIIYLQNVKQIQQTPALYLSMHKCDDTDLIDNNLRFNWMQGGKMKPQKFNHKKDCDCAIVNPITEWVGGSNLIITGYKCPKCGEETLIENHESKFQNPYSYTNNIGEHIT